MKKLLLFLIFLLAARTLKAQKYFFPEVDGTRNQIKSYMAQMGGQMKIDKFVTASFDTPAHRELDYTLPQSDKDDIYLANFYFDKKGTCFQQNLWYGSDKFSNKFINLFSDPNTGWKRFGKSLKWERANLVVEILKSNPKNIFKRVPFILQLKKKRLDKDAEWVQIKPYKQ